MGVSTYLWDQVLTAGHICQLFLMTHNFELFRQWDIQLQGAKKYVKGCTYEILSRHRPVKGEIIREPVIKNWPPNRAVRKKMRSNYHHGLMLLEEAKRSLDQKDNMETRLDAQLLFPNVARRVLETFLAFKIPSMVGNFDGSMREAGNLLERQGYQGANALRLRTTRFLHALSHDDTPESGAVIQPDETRAALAAVFEFMNALDSEHMDGLCDVLGLDKATLLTS